MRQFCTLFITITLLLLVLHNNATADNTSYKRIISLYPAHTENIVSLGAEASLIGISSSDTYPLSIQKKPRFSAQDDAERFLALRPDLVLIRPMLARSYAPLFTKLKAAGVTVISLQPQGIRQKRGNTKEKDILYDKVSALFSYWRELGKIVSREKEAEKMIITFKQEVKNIKQRTKDIQKSKKSSPPKIYFETMHNKSRTVAKGSIAAFVIEASGGINIADDATQVRKTNIAYYPKEKLLAKGEIIDVFIAQRGRMNSIDRDIILHESGYMAIRAVREKQVYIVPEEIVSRPTLRIIDGIKLINNILYP